MIAELIYKIITWAAESHHRKTTENMPINQKAVNTYGESNGLIAEQSRENWRRIGDLEEKFQALCNHLNVSLYKPPAQYKVETYGERERMPMGNNLTTAKGVK